MTDEENDNEDQSCVDMPVKIEKSGKVVDMKGKKKRTSTLSCDKKGKTKSANAKKMSAKKKV